MLNYAFNVAATTQTNNVSISCNQEIVTVDEIDSYHISISITFQLSSSAVANMYQNKLQVRCTLTTTNEGSLTSHGRKNEYITYTPDAQESVTFDDYVIVITENEIAAGETFTVEIVFLQYELAYRSYQYVEFDSTRTFVFAGESSLLDSLLENSLILLLFGGLALIIFIVCILYFNNPKTINYQRFKEKN